MKKRIISALLAAGLMISASGCVNTDSSYVPLRKNDNARISVVCTTFPEYDWVRQLTGKYNYEFEVTYLLGNGTDIHSFQPSASDMALISGCDLFICVGGESEQWINSALREPINKDIRVVKLMELLGDRAFAEEQTEGMQTSEQVDTDDAENGEYEGYDEHVWLSLTNADIFCAEITEQLCALDAAHKDDYRANYAEYSASLKQLDTSYRELFASVTEPAKRTLVFADRFPFRYFTEDYGLDYYAAFPGCSAESEASFETVAFLAGKLDELELRTLFVIDGSDRRIADAVIESTGREDISVTSLSSLQSVTEDTLKNNGTTYIAYMQSNYRKLKEAFEKEAEEENE